MLVVGFLACQFSLLGEQQEHQELTVSFKDIRIEIKDICFVTFITFFVVFQIWHQYQKGIRRQVVHYLVCALHLEIFFRLDSLVVVLCGTMFGAGSASVHMSHGFKCSWLWHATSPSAPEAKKSLKVKKVPKRANNCVRMQEKSYNLHASRELVSPVCLSPSCLQAN